MRALTENTIKKFENSFLKLIIKKSDKMLVKVVSFSDKIFKLSNKENKNWLIT